MITSKEQKNIDIHREVSGHYQELFNLMSKEHGLILTIQEMDEIIHECRKLEKRLGNGYRYM